jgi:hypothetical protein
MASLSGLGNVRFAFGCRHAAPPRSTTRRRHRNDSRTLAARASSLIARLSSRAPTRGLAAP